MPKSNKTESNFILDGSRVLINGAIDFGSSLIHKDFLYSIATPVTWPICTYEERNSSESIFPEIFVRVLNIAGLIYSKNYRILMTLINLTDAVFTGDNHNDHNIAGAITETGLVLAYHSDPYGLPIAAVGLVG
jgi:hypothetical protein